MVPPPANLTEQLYQRGFLPTGEVLGAIAGQRFEAFADAVLRLDLTYSDDSPSSAPATLICKQSGPAWYEVVRLPELRFYTELAPLLQYNVAPTFYGVIHNPPARTCTLLLEDLAQDYERVILPVAEAELMVVVDTLAKHHAFWWNHPILSTPALQTPAPAGDVTRMSHALNAQGLCAKEVVAWRDLEDFIRCYAYDLTQDELKLFRVLCNR